MRRSIILSLLLLAAGAPGAKAHEGHKEAGGVWAFNGSRKAKPAAARQAQAALVATLLCAVVAGWISHAGGQVRHSEFRMGPPVHNAKPMQESRRPGLPK